MKKKILSIVLGVMMIVGMLPAGNRTIYAQENTTATEWHVGDKINLEGWFCNSDSNNDQYYGTGANCDIVTPVLEDGQYIFEEQIYYNMIIDGTSGRGETDYASLCFSVPEGKDASEAPIGFKVKSGNGDLNDPYRFELVYKTNVTSVGLDKETVTLFAGGTEGLVATVSPDNATYKNVTWSSNNPEVATVDENGVVTGVAAGRATITARATNGTESDTDDKTATCAVTVNPAPEPSKLTLSAGENGKVVMGSGIYGNARDESKILSIDYTMDIQSTAKFIGGNGESIKLINDASINIHTGGLVSFYPAADNTGTITATPDTGYAFAGWYNGETLYSENAVLDYKNITEDLTLTAKFEKITEYPLWVGGTQVTSANAADVLANDEANKGKVSFTPATTGANPPTLTLEGANIATGYKYNDGDSEDKAGIYYAGSENLMIVLADNSENNIAGSSITDGILSSENEAKVTITGNGKLTISTVGNNSQGIFASGEIEINGSTVNVTVNGENSEGIYTDNNITIKNNATVNASALGKNSDGIEAFKVTFSNATVTGIASGEDSNGINADDVVQINGGTVTATVVTTTDDYNSHAILGTVKNNMAGTGWTNTAGTEGKADIAINTSGQDLSSYKKVQFPDAPLTPWAKLQRQIFNAEDDAIIKLTEDVTALERDVALIVPEDKEITIDLAGHTLDRGLKEEAEVRGGVIIVAGSLTIEDSSSDKTGKITGGNNTEDGGGITLDGGSLVINGGNISGNKARYGGGVYVESGDFNLNSGSITENASEDNGGGVYIDNSESVFTMKKDAVISNNKARNGGGVFVDIGRFKMNGGTISNNICTEDGGGVHALNDCVFVISGGSITGNSAGRDGGAVYNEGDLTVEDAKITDNEAECGAGIYNTGDLTIKETEISGNEADDGGAVYNEGDFGLISGSFTRNEARYGGAVYNKGDFNMTDGMITGNAAKVDGGGVFHFDGEFYMENGTISENTSEESGGGVCTRSDSLFTMENGEISGNRSDYYGGGVYNEGNFVLEDGKIVDNTAGLQGGGVYDHGDDYFTMSGGEITGNTVDNPGGDADAAGGGVYMSKDTAALNLAGNSVITDNTLGGEDNNVYLEKDMTLTVIDELTSDALIGISMEEPGIFTNSTSSVNASTYIKNFSSDDTSYTVQTEAQELKLGTEVFPLWVNGVQVSSVNKDNVLADDEINKDKVSFTPGNGTDPATLTLSGVMITKGYLLPTTTSSTSGIVYDGDEELVIVVQSNTENSINVTSESSTDGIFAHKAKVTITGGGKLDLKGSEDGVFVNELIIDDAEVVVNGGSTGVYVKDGDVIVSSGLLDTTGDNLAGLRGETIKIGKNVSVIATGGMFACPNTIINEVAGTGWTDMAGTEGEEAIPVNTVEKQYLEYKRIKFPSHIHKFIYETGTGENANTITATCETPDCPLSEHKATLTIHAPLHKTFDDKKVPDVTIDDIDRIRNNASVKYYKASDGEKTGESFDEAPLDPGEYWAEITLGEGDNTATAHVVYTVAKANMMVTANRWRGTYDGKEHSITVNVIAPEGATIAYATTDSGEYDLTENPSFSDVGSYAVYFCVTKENYNTVMRMKTVEITGAELTDVSVTQNGTLTYNSTAQTPEVNTSAKTVDGSEVTFTYSASRKGTYGTMPTVTDAGEYTFYYKATAPNHEDASGTFTVTMNKATAPEVVTPTPEAVTYDPNKTLANIELPEGWTWADDTIVPTVKNEGYEAQFSVTDDDNYDYSEVKGYNVETHKVIRTVALTVNKADNPATVSSTASVKRGGNDVDLSENVTLNGTTGVVSYEISSDPNGCTMNGSKLISGEKTGTVTVNVRVAEDDNYKASDAKTITVTITEKDTQTISAEDLTATIGDTGMKINATITTGDGSLSYKVTSGDAVTVDNSGNLTILKEGKAVVTITASETKAYAEESKEVTVTINPIDKSKLESAIEAAKAYNNSIKDVSDFKKEADEVQKLIETAQKALEEAKNQKEIDDATTALNNALANNLKKLSDKLPETDKATLDNEETIKAADKALNALTADQKALVDNSVKVKIINDAALVVAIKEGKYFTFKGDNGQWTRGSSSTLPFTIKHTLTDDPSFDLAKNATYRSFKGIKVDGKSVSEKTDGILNYTYIPGSVKIDLLPDYLKTLSVSDHTLTVEFAGNMSATAKFKVLKESSSGGNTPSYIPPKTGIE